MPGHVLLCCFGAVDRDEVLHQAAALCSTTGAGLSVVVPIVDADVPDGCCGIQAQPWRRLLDEDTRDELRRARRVLAQSGCHPVHASAELGRSVGSIVQAIGAAWGCDAVAVARPRPWSLGARRRLEVLRRDLACEVIELPRH
ncbi:MAG: hypothetical protein QOG11_1840, partial [Solirubrobacteraceae bacterium]|nr:hypothetical protein [Solirubrobacteraceae bacterium]